MNTRLGFHYFEDQDHYQAKDLDLWLQELISLAGAQSFHQPGHS